MTYNPRPTLRKCLGALSRPRLERLHQHRDKALLGRHAADWMVKENKYDPVILALFGDSYPKGDARYYDMHERTRDIYDLVAERHIVNGITMYPLACAQATYSDLEAVLTELLAL